MLDLSGVFVKVSRVALFFSCCVVGSTILARVSCAAPGSEEDETDTGED